MPEQRLERLAQLLDESYVDSGLSDDLREAVRYMSAVKNVELAATRYRSAGSLGVMQAGHDIEITNRMAGGHKTLLEALESCKASATSAVAM